MSWRAPLAEIDHILTHVIGADRLAETERFAEAGPDTRRAVLEEAAKIAEGPMAGCNRDGDLHPARLENGVVRTSPGFREAYQMLAEGGWCGVAADPEHGGMGLPQTVWTAVNDLFSGANLSLSLCPLLTCGHIEALEAHAPDDVKALYLPKLISGEWTGTMNLTEPQAGTDLAALRAKATPKDDGSYAVEGQKIYITWGDHDMAANVSHLVLARLPDAPPGVRGISLFVVPKYIPNADGSLGEANKLRVVSLEHKLGIHGSPTCVMSFEGATGWLIGEAHNGLACMFTMMNNARLGVGAQGVAMADAACQKALAYARERQQGRTATGEPTIIGHPDVRRMLLTMQGRAFAARAIAYLCALHIDLSHAGEDRAASAARAGFLTPIAKAFGTDAACEAAELGVQVHGGMGYVEETGAAQIYRDARITPIYEGTNGVQALDMVGRKLADGGAAARALLDEIKADLTEGALDAALVNAHARVAEATDWMLAAEMVDRAAGATPFLRGWALLLGGWLHLRAARADEARLPLARYFITQELAALPGLLAQATAGAEPLLSARFDAA